MMAKEIERFNRLRALAERHGFKLEGADSRDGKFKMTELNGRGCTLYGGFKGFEDFLAKRETKTARKA